MKLRYLIFSLLLLPSVAFASLQTLPLWHDSRGYSYPYVATDNFGIGTTSPFATLSVVGSTSPFTVANTTNTNLLSIDAGGNFTLGTSSKSGGALYWQNSANRSLQFFGLYDTGNAMYYGLSSTCPTPTVNGANSAGLCGYFAGMGIAGSTNGANQPIFGVLNSGQSSSGIGNTAFTIFDNNKIQDFYNVLDDGAGNVGLGTTSPWARLSISSTVQQSTIQPLFAVASTTNANLFQVFNNGAVAIGATTTSVIPFSIVGSTTPAVWWERTTGQANNDFVTIQNDNDALFNTTGSLMVLNQKDTSSSGNIFKVTNSNPGGTSYSDATVYTSGTGISFGVGSSLTTGSIMSVGGSSQGSLTNFTSNIFNIAPTRLRTGAGTTTDSGNFLNLTRLNETTTNAGAGMNIIGSLINASSTCVSVTGYCADASTLVAISQNTAVATGTVMTISNRGAGNTLTTSAGNIGFGTTSPYATLSVQSGTSAGDAFVVATSSQNAIGGYDNDGHRFSSGPAPVVSSCGTGSGSVTGDDQSGVITTATAATACTLTFSKSYQKTPTCTVTDNSLVGFADVASISTTAVTFGISSALTGGNLYYSCQYHK